MLYYLFEILESQFNLPGACLFSYLSFRAAVTVIMSLVISIVFNDKSTNNGGAAVVGPSLPSDAKGDPKKPNYISAEPSNATIPDLPRIVQDLGKLAHREGLASSTIDRTHEDGGSGAGKKRTIGEGDDDELQWEDLQFEM